MVWEVMENRAALGVILDGIPKEKYLFRRGVERECLRTTTRGAISLKDHPKQLGSALTHPYITTDFSEALLELITPVHFSAQSCYEFLQKLHFFVSHHIADELLWPCSMPCPIYHESAIRLAQYGTSNIGKMKHIYRVGLKNRYGSLMQAISGVHYNWSLSEDLWALLQKSDGDHGPLQEFKTKKYFGLLRNFNRYGMIIPYLFGASNLVCKQFLAPEKSAGFEAFDGQKNVLWRPNSTSLRLSDVGYQNDQQSGIPQCFNSLPSYNEGLSQAISTPSPKFSQLGVVRKGKYTQLSESILQIENEFYGPIRPKRTTSSGESPTRALRERGVEYIEVRALDVNPFDPCGVSIEQMLFFDVFLFYCLTSDSPPLTKEDMLKNNHNLQLVANGGLNGDIDIYWGNSKHSFISWAKRLFEVLIDLAKLADRGPNEWGYHKTLIDLNKMVTKERPTLARQFIDDLQSSKMDYFEYHLQRAKKNKSAIFKLFADETINPEFIELSKKSHRDQEQLEQSDQLFFDEFLKKYYCKNR